MLITHHHNDGSTWNIECHVTTNGETYLKFYYTGIADNNHLVNTIKFKTMLEAHHHLSKFLERCKQADA